MADHLAASHTDPETQFQIGDRVLYLPEGVYCTVEGYFWLESIGEPPSILGYRLSCGIIVNRDLISRGSHG